MRPEAKYYVTAECNGCSICASYAPYHFSPTDDGAFYVSRQPMDDDEEQAFQEAIEACPLQCIREHGDD